MSKTILLTLFEEFYQEIIIFIDGADEFNNENSFQMFVGVINRPIQMIIWSRLWMDEEIICDIKYELTGFNEQQ